MVEKMLEIREKYNLEERGDAIPDRAVEEILNFYPLYGRPENAMRDRIVESIEVAGNPRF